MRQSQSQLKTKHLKLKIISPPSVIPTEVHRRWTKRRDLATELNKPADLSFPRSCTSTLDIQIRYSIFFFLFPSPFSFPTECHPERSAAEVVGWGLPHHFSVLVKCAFSPNQQGTSFILLNSVEPRITLGITRWGHERSECTPVGVHSLVGLHARSKVTYSPSFIRSMELVECRSPLVVFRILRMES